MTQKLYSDPKVEKKDNGDINITAALTKEAISNAREKAIKSLGENLKLDGFRPGHIPEKIILEKVGEFGVLQEAADIVLPEAVYQIFMDEKIEAIGRPKISITKLAPGEPVEFTLTTSTVPEIKLPDYKKIAKKEGEKPSGDIEVTEKDVDETLKELQKLRVRQNEHQKQQAEGKVPDLKNAPEPKEEDLPELNDEFAKSLGGFKDLADLKEKIKENIAKDKAAKAKNKVRVLIAEALVEETKTEPPTALVDSELARMHAQFEDDVTRAGLTMEDYLKKAGKTKEDISNDWRPDAVKKAKLQLIIDAIAKDAKIGPKPEDIDRETKQLLETYKDADEARTRAYVDMMLTNEEVFKFLESQAESKKQPSKEQKEKEKEEEN